VSYARRVARTDYPVLIEGETGTGKELLASALHHASGRRGRFVPLNCGAVPETLFEAELFGAIRGAYTGLETPRDGLFAAAEGGTLFLDEVAEMPLTCQAKLLRALQDGAIRPLGSTTPRQIDVRVVAATHRSLSDMARGHQFRSDLYYRLSAVRLELPPLRERVGDIEPLLRSAVAKAADHQDVPEPSISAEALGRARGYAWPGNVRELIHAAAGAVLTGADPLTSSEFPWLSPEAERDGPPGDAMALPYFAALAEFERRYLRALLERVDGNQSAAARSAGLSRSALREKAQRHGLIGAPVQRVTRSRVRRARATA